MTHRLKRHRSSAALALGILSVALLAGGIADAQRASKPRSVVRLDRKGKIPTRVLPKVPAARSADTLGDLAPADLQTACNPESVDLGTWCLMSNPYPLTAEETGKNNYAFATQKCVDLGGYLPSAEQLIGAANRVKLASTVDDDQLTASIDIDPTDGLKDRREMSATLITTAAGSSAAGSQGVSDGSRGDPKTGEPDPAPQPASPYPETLQYVTVYDNKDKGGFAGGRPVAQAELFRCAFDKAQGAGTADEG